MIAYFLIFLLCSFGFYLDDLKSKYSNSFFVLLFLYLLFLIGLRFEVGGDWSSYAFYYERAQTVNFRYYISLNEFSYAVINYLSSLVSGGILLVNIICASIFISPLILKDPLPTW